MANGFISTDMPRFELGLGTSAALLGYHAGRCKTRSAVVPTR
jgi:hypothetical protein